MLLNLGQNLLLKVHWLDRASSLQRGRSTLIAIHGQDEGGLRERALRLVAHPSDHLDLFLACVYTCTHVILLLLEKVFGEEILTHHHRRVPLCRLHSTLDSQALWCLAVA